MSREKLTEALLDKRDDRARSLWHEVEQQADRYRQEAKDRCAEQRLEAERRHEAKLGQQRDRLDSRTAKRRRRTRLLAEEIFSSQLRQLALEQLQVLLTEDRAGSIQFLSAELPERDWQQVIVHPDDQKQAAKLFPGCTILTDPALFGGVIASTADGTICVDNSLIRRLDQAWPELCGSLLDELQSREGTDDEGVVA